jgi:hypothetical protein
MKLDTVVKELRKDNWLTGITFIEDHRDFLQALVDETEKQLTIPDVIGSVSAHIHYDLSLKAMQLMVDKEELTVEEFRELPEVKKLWLAMDVIKEHYLIT